MTAVHLLALLGIAAGAFAQSVTGMGFALVASPLLVLHLGPQDGVAATVALAVLASAIPLARDAGQARPREVLRLLVPALACTPVLALLLAGADAGLLAPAAGAAVVVGAALLACGFRWAWLHRPSGAVVTGAASALLNVVGGVGGPPVGLYAANAGWEPRRARGNLLCFFLLQNCVTAAVLGVVLPGLLDVAAVALGAVGGAALAPRLPATTVRAGVLGASLLGGVALVVGTA